jgi:hypothetical protein
MEKRIHAWLTAINYIMGVRVFHIDTFLKNHPTKDFAIGLWLHNWPYHFNKDTGARRYVVPKEIDAGVYNILRKHSLRYVSFGYQQVGEKVKIHGKDLPTPAKWLVPFDTIKTVEQLAEWIIISERRIIKEMNVNATYDDEIKSVLAGLRNQLLDESNYDTASALIARWGALVLIERYLIESNKIRDKMWITAHHALDHIILANVCFCVAIKTLFDEEDTWCLSVFAEKFVGLKNVKEKQVTYREAYNWMKSMEITVLSRLGWNVFPSSK